MTSSRICRSLLVALALPALALASPQTRAQGDATSEALSRAIVASDDTPSGEAWLPLALSEARMALQQALMANEANGDLEGMKRHATSVQQAIERAHDGSGSGLRMSVSDAVRAICNDVAIYAVRPGQASPRIAVTSALSACRNILQLSAASVKLATDIMNAGTSADAAPMAAELLQVTRQLIEGTDPQQKVPSFKNAERGGLLALQYSLGVLWTLRERNVPGWMREVSR